MILLFTAIGAFLFSSCTRSSKNKNVSTWITLSEKDKSPYGAYVFYESLKKFFPKATLTNNASDIYEIDSTSIGGKDKLLVILLPFFNPSEQELDYIMDFVEKGNNVFLCTFEPGYELEQLIKVEARTLYVNMYPFGNSGPFEMKQTLVPPVFKGNQTFKYPGQWMEGYFYKMDTTIARTLSKNEKDYTNFVLLKRGKGNLFVHLSPMSFTNYFLLYNDNHHYFEQIFSLLPATTSTIIWDKHFNVREGSSGGGGRQTPPNWFASIMKNPSFRAGILTALLLLLIFTITEVKRRQRAIPVIKPPVNDSLEFVKTMGLLYYQRKDHQNLSQKISAYFLEYVRSRFRIFAKEMDENFVKELSYKSGADEGLILSIVEQIKKVNNNEKITDKELIVLQRNIEAFYEKK